MSIEAGTVLGHYEIDALLGAGGMGEVYRARDRKLGRDVAVKVLPGGLAANAAALERFKREARAVAALSHPNILAIYDFGMAEGQAYAVMELLEGQTLRERLADGPIAPVKAAEIARAIARGLGAAHEKGVVHRDLKPDNVFVTTDGQVKVLDFGLAIAREIPGTGSSATTSPTQTSLTAPGSVLGTVGYMAPEQVRGEPADHRSDLFSLGAVLYEMMTGSRPFQRETSAETMTAILREEPPDPGSTGPPALLRVVRRCMEKQPNERFQSARDLAFAIENSTDTSGVGAVTAVTGASARARRRVWGWLALAALLGLVAGYVLRGAGGGVAAVPEPPRVRRLTVSGYDHQPNASPDGRMLAFTSSRDGTPRIWLKQLAGGGEQPLTDGPDIHAKFSPDGSTILFLREENEMLSIYRQALVGGNPRKLVAGAGDLAWSPDGRRLGFIRGLTRDERRVSEIRVTDAQRGGDGRLIYSAERGLYGLSWAPDGSRLVAVETTVTGNSTNYLLVMIDPDGGEPQHYSPDAGEPKSPPMWVNADTLVFARAGSLLGDQGDPLSRVVCHDLITGEETTLFWARNLFPTQGVRLDFTEFSMVGPGLLAFHQTDVRQHLRIAGGRELTRGEGRDRQPVYSPDGRKVLFTSNRSGNLDLWMMDLESGALEQLTDDTAQDWDPGFSPDGRSIVWSSDRTGHLEIWVANNDGSGARQLTQDGKDAENPTVTADGQWVVFWSANPDKLGLWKIRLDGSDATLLVDGPHSQPDVSPDGRYAAYLSLEVDTLVNILRVADVDTGEVLPFEIAVPTPIRAPAIIMGRMRWLPDGSALAYIGLDGEDRTGVFAQDFMPGRDTSDTRRKIAGFSPDYVTESFGISPDGEDVVVAGIRRSYRLMLAEGVEGIE